MEADRLAGTEPLAEGGRIDRQRLAGFLRDNVPGCSGEMTIERFRGGQSNPTMLISFENGRKLVLRKKPDGTLLPSAHAVDREFRVIKALAETDVPVPQAHVLCDDETIVGAMFYVMDFAQGRSFWDPSLPDLTPAERTAIFDEMNRTIARLHSVDYVAIGLETFGKPGNYIGRQVGRWSKQYRASETETIEAMDRLIEWLPENLPADRPPALLHGDFRLDNMIIHPTEPKVIALLDWELSTLGDPVADFAYHMLTWHLPKKPYRGLADHDLEALGIPGIEQYRSTYFKRMGLEDIGPREWNTYLAYSFFRVAAIRQGIMKRVVDGTASSHFAQEAGKLARPTAELALHFAEAADRAR